MTLWLQKASLQSLTTLPYKNAIFAGASTFSHVRLPAQKKDYIRALLV